MEIMLLVMPATIRFAYEYRTGAWQPNNLTRHDWKALPELDTVEISGVNLLTLYILTAKCRKGVDSTEIFYPIKKKRLPHGQPFFQISTLLLQVFGVQSLQLLKDKQPILAD